MQHVISKDEIAHGITNPDVFQQLDIITDTWDGIKKSRELETISEDDRRLLLRRLMNYRSDPGSATDWADLKQVVYDRAPVFVEKVSDFADALAGVVEEGDVVLTLGVGDIDSVAPRLATRNKYIG